jgi:osmotically-inducible protein OsmY
MVSAPQRIESDLNEALDIDCRVDAAQVNVRIKGANVTLAGCVASHSAVEAAEENARGTGGVHGITNKLAVVPTGRYGDEQIARRVLDAFERTAALDPGSITVEVDRGTVTLTGTVEDCLVRALARGITLCTVGVLYVENRLTIRTNDGHEQSARAGGRSDAG